MKKKSNIVASVRTPKEKFYVRIVAEGYAVCHGTHAALNETDMTTAIAIMLRMAYFETKQQEFAFE